MESVSMDFRPDGSLEYSIDLGDRLQIMNLTYAVEGDFIVSNQPSSPQEERTKFSLGADGRLELDYGGVRSWYERVG
jgi:hypothetical protein